MFIGQLINVNVIAKFLEILDTIKTNNVSKALFNRKIKDFIINTSLLPENLLNRNWNSASFEQGHVRFHDSSEKEFSYRNSLFESNVTYFHSNLHYSVFHYCLSILFYNLFLILAIDIWSRSSGLPVDSFYLVNQIVN